MLQTVDCGYCASLQYMAKTKNKNKNKRLAENLSCYFTSTPSNVIHFAVSASLNLKSLPSRRFEKYISCFIPDEIMKNHNSPFLHNIWVSNIHLSNTLNFQIKTKKIHADIQHGGLVYTHTHTHTDLLAQSFVYPFIHLGMLLFLDEPCSLCCKY